VDCRAVTGLRHAVTRPFAASDHPAAC
jgi:hypothetical protein